MRIRPRKCKSGKIERDDMSPNNYLTAHSFKLGVRITVVRKQRKL